MGGSSLTILLVIPFIDLDVLSSVNDYSTQ